ncbi:hypothetical protein JJC00_32205 [Bradyrhizobium diazoefficiens]|nr:hypothetical protein JJC00_32205 [Bradyrhizobium diazoefficiens]
MATEPVGAGRGRLDRIRGRGLPVGRQTDVGGAVAHQPQDQRHQQQQVTDIALSAMVGAEILGN